MNRAKSRNVPVVGSEFGGVGRVSHRPRDPDRPSALQRLPESNDPKRRDSAKAPALLAFQAPPAARR